MARHAAWLGSVWLAAAGALGASGPLETSVDKARAMLVKEDLGAGIYVFRAPEALDYWTATNSTVVVNDDDVVVFDSCTRAVTAKAVIAEIRKLTDKPVRVLVNSHWHQDHWSGNDEYAKAFPGLRIVATEEMRAYMARMGPRFFLDELESAGRRRMHEDLESGLKTGNLVDGSPFTPEVRARKEKSAAKADQFAAEIEALPRVLPNLVYRNEMAFWSGRREFRLTSMTGDATASTVLYLPAERILVTGDVLATPEDGKGPPPWTTNSYAITPWLESLRRFDALETVAIVPGQGPVLHDKTYLRRTIALFAAVLDQVHAGLERGLVTLSEVQKSVDVDRIATDYAPGEPLPEDFPLFLQGLTKKSMQEAVDGAANVK